MKRLFAIEVQIPDEIQISDREIIEAAESGIKLKVLKLFKDSLPVEHHPNHVKYRHLSEEVQFELRRQSRAIDRRTIVERVQ